VGRIHVIHTAFSVRSTLQRVNTDSQLTCRLTHRSISRGVFVPAPCKHLLTFQGSDRGIRVQYYY